jgi:hypothetical protein
MPHMSLTLLATLLVTAALPSTSALLVAAAEAAAAAAERDVDSGSAVQKGSPPFDEQAASAIASSLCATP